jgi:hypothetical protein
MSINDEHDIEGLKCIGGTRLCATSAVLWNAARSGVVSGSCAISADMLVSRVRPASHQTRR